MSIAKAIRAEAEKKHFTIQDSRTEKIYNLLNELYRKSPVENEEIRFERQLFTRGTGKERTGLHTSAIINSDNYYCCREQVLSLIYKGKNMNLELPHNTLRIFEEGNYIHRKWQRLFLRGGLAEVEGLDKTLYNEKYMISYSPDIIATIFGKKVIVEIKSMNEFAYKKVTHHASGDKQCRMYMLFSNINYGLVLMENKNNQDFKLTMLKADEHETAPYITRLDDIKYAYDNKEMPPRRPDCKTKLSKRCLGCAMVEPCWASKSERKVYLLGQN